MQKLIQSKAIFAIIIIALFAIMYLFNYLYPIYVDDWMYRFCWIPYGYSPNIVSSFKDIVISQYNHYFHWGGRTVAHIIAQLLLWMGEDWGNLLNTIAYVLLCLIMYKIANVKNKLNSGVFAFVIFGMWFLQPKFSLCILLITFSSNYVWTTLIILLFIYQFCNYYLTNKTTDNISKLIAIFFFGIIAGWTNENMGPAIISFILLFIYILKFQEKREIPRWVIVGLIGFIIGYVILFVAPGNYTRMKIANTPGMLSLAGLELRFKFIFNCFIDVLIIPSIIYLICFLLFKKTNSNSNKKQIQNLSLLFLIAAIISFLVLFYIPNTGYHALFGTISLIITASAILFANVNFDTKKLRIPFYAVLGMIVLYFCFTSYQKYTCYNYTYHFWKNRTEFIEKEKSKGNYDIEFTEYYRPSEDIGIYNLPHDKYHWINMVYARYHGLEFARQK